VNPRIGSGLQDGRGVVEEEAVEVVRNHEGGTRMGTGIPISKGGRDGAGTLRTRPPGRRTPRRTNDGGAIFGQPHERKPGATTPGRKDRNASVIGAKVRRVAYTNTSVKVSDPVDGSSKVPRVATRAKATEGSGERPGSRDIDRIPSRAGGTCRSDVGRAPRVRVRARLRTGELGCCSRSGSDPLRLEEGSDAKDIARP
jgi:hypothetical protein